MTSNSMAAHLKSLKLTPSTLALGLSTQDQSICPQSTLPRCGILCQNQRPSTSRTQIPSPLQGPDAPWSRATPLRARRCKKRVSRAFPHPWRFAPFHLLRAQQSVKCVAQIHL
ncbi:hypothetical protein FGO68_gene12657 [Halteria grandinella]|uniref:Uncharacterized protein n=1 Tax=Halteria grandinella TaxID=5974 RepID=A0A8J8NRN4_HALGN|nr:hypothetical protein FGO68_gene12657 [Halteria grandinella]